MPGTRGSVNSKTSWSLDMLPGFVIGGANYIQKPESCKGMCYKSVCCFHEYYPYRAAGGKKMTYSNSCTPCCNWTVLKDDNMLGTIKRASCCDNGCMYFLCSCFVCKEIFLIKFMDADANMDGTVRVYDGCLRKLCGSVAEPCSLLCNSCLDSCAYTCGQNMIVISEKIFNGDLENHDPVAEVHQVFGVSPVPGTCCCAYRYPIRSAIKATPALVNKEMLAVFSILPQMQAGYFQNGGIIPRMPLLGAATGSMCDCGRYVTFKRMKFEDMLNMTGGAPATTVDDDSSFTMATAEGSMLLSDEELQKLPTKPWLFGNEVVVKPDTIERL